MRSPMARRANGEGSRPLRRKDGRYQVNVWVKYDDESRKRVTVTGKTASACRDAVLTLKHQQKTNSLVKPERLSLAAFLERWMRDVKAASIRPKSFRSYEGAIKNHITPALGSKSLQRIGPAEIASAIAGMTMVERDPKQKRTRPAGSRTKELTYAVIIDALDTALRWKLVTRNAALAVDKPRVKKTEMRFLNSEEVLVFLARAESDRLYALYLLAIFTGMRPGEMYALQWDQVNLDAETILVTHTFDPKARTREEVKTPNARRTIEISQRVVSELRAHRARMLAEGHPHGFVFVTPEGEPIREDYVRRSSFHPIRDAASIAYLRLYDLRHTAATLMIAAGTHIKVISERMGHASVAFTLDTYGHVMPTMRKDAALALDRFMPKDRISALN